MKKYGPVFPMCPPYICTHAYTQKPFYTTLSIQALLFSPTETEEALEKNDVSLEVGMGRPSRAGIAGVYMHCFPWVEP